MDQNFVVEKVVGKGTYGVVYKAQKKVNEEIVAVKEINMESLKEEGIPSTALREISLLQTMQENEGDHLNVVRLFNVLYSATDPYLLLVFEFVERDLKKYMAEELHNPNTVRNRATAKSSKVDMLPVEKVMHFAKQLLEGIKHCHHASVIHRDLKPQNILVTNNDIIKIADFGLARSVNMPLRTYTREVVTLWYRCPELLLGVTRYAFAVDMWSLGCIIGELLNAKPLFTGDSEIGQLFEIFKRLGTPTGPLSTLPDFNPEFPRWKSAEDKFEVLLPRLKSTNPSLKPLFEGLLEYCPRKRLRSEEALRLEVFGKAQKES